MKGQSQQVPDVGIVRGRSSAPRQPRQRARPWAQGLAYTPLVVLWIALAGSALAAQMPTSIGLASVGAAGAYGGATRVERNADGYELGVLVDFGWLRTPSLRLQGELAMVRATLTETVEIENRTYRDHFFDLTGSLALVALLRDARHRVLPYATIGIGVHALSSSFGSITIDPRYNANPFGSHAGAGAQLRLGSSGRRALFAEVRRTIAEHVDRTTLRVGGVALFHDLRRPSPR